MRINNKLYISYARNIMCIMLVIILMGLTACNYIHNSHMGRNNTDKTLKPLIIGSDNYVPYSYLDSDGNFTGIDVEIAKEACRRMGYTPVFKQIIWDNKDIYLNEGAVDCLWGCFTMTDREDKYNWAGPYMYSRQIVVVNKDSGIESIADLKGKRVAVQVTSKPEYILSHANVPADTSDNGISVTDSSVLKNGVKVPQVGVLYSMSTMEELFASMRKGYVDAIAGHENAMNIFIQSNEERFSVLPEELSISELGVAFSLNNDSGIDKKLTEVLNEMKADGTIQSIAEKYGIDVSMSVWGN